MADTQLDGSTYEVIRKRLEEQAGDLKTRVGQLNGRRQELFGGTESVMLSTQRVRTEHNCIPRDMVAINPQQILLGYQVFMGLKSEISISDVFTKLDFDGETLQPAPLKILTDQGFSKDFKEIFQYYKDARLLQLRRMETNLLMVFQTGERASDLKVMRWGRTGDHIAYVDNRGERDHVFPPAHDFTWERATREMHVQGAHPHVNILDQLFVECIGGDLTIKIEDNTTTGAGIFAEDVEERSQGLDDAEILYADLEAAILLKIRPYREELYRYIVYNKQTEEAVRIDSMGFSCQELPEGHGLIFPNGYYLADGSYKVFPVEAEDMEFVRQIRSPNGEDVAYIYHHRINGVYHILQYNLITREVANPLICNGYSLFPDGKVVIFRADPEPQRMHAMQIWQTSFCSEEYAAQQEPSDGSHLATIGNRELVRGISELLQIVRLIGNQRPTMGVYEELLKSIARIRDSFHWLGHEESFGLLKQLEAVQQTANQVIDEFEKVRQLTEQAAQQLHQLQQSCRDVFRDIAISGQDHIDGFVEGLAQLRARRGQIDTARDVRYIDLAALDELEKEVVEHVERLSQEAVQFLLQDTALQPYTEEIAELEQQAEGLDTVSAAEPITERVDGLSDGLDLLMDIVNGLDIEDATQRTDILERISEVYGQLNRARAVLEGRRKELGTREGRAEFGAQFKLLSQTVANYLSLCDSPDKTDEFLAKLMVQVEELEAKFIEFDEFAEQLSDKRSEVYEVFQARKQSLVDDRNRRAEQLGRSADRILDSVRKRALGFTDLDELNAFLASDPMVMKARSIVGELRDDLGDTVKADDLESRIKSLREDAVRNLRDKSELFEGDAVVKFGRHRFSVNTQALDLTMLVRDEGMCFHLSGTDYYEHIDDEAFQATRPYWNQERISETDQVYRAEYLAYQIWQAAEQGQENLSVSALQSAVNDDAACLELVRRFASQRYEEAYERGLHDHDAVLILQGLWHLLDSAGLQRFPVPARSLACLWWTVGVDAQQQELWQTRCRSLLRLRDAFGPSAESRALAQELSETLAACAQQLGWSADASRDAIAGEYVLQELGRQESAGFLLGGEAETLHDRFLKHLELLQARQAFDADMRALHDRPDEAWQLARAWVYGYAAAEQDELLDVVDEVAALLITGDRLPREVVHGRTHKQVEGLLGQHPLIQNKCMELRLDEFLARLSHFSAVTVPGYQSYQAQRRQILEQERERLRLEEFKPRVLTSFVRNRLINEVYLPLLGDNLAKQMGALGDSKRTDLMGLLLLISPPGYGKTTLMEYVASTLGLTFMKINGPAIGHEVGSLDPQEAPNATAAQELQKLNLSLEMGNNIMLYLDDIQHCNPEFLQKFISLCDGQRRIEGVWRGRTQTYDLRGKKVCVVMAGNPYTESGEKFQIPDMLANRADTYNLGDIIGGSSDAFELSYLENSLTVNPVLNPVASRGQKDFYKLLRVAEGDDEARSQLEHPYSSIELDEICGVLKKLRRIQEVLLAVNQLYIQSASMNDEDRTEPAFKLQGSYRNMAKLAEKVVAVMNDAELDQLILDHYLSESQTLTQAAEANLLRFKELCGWLEGEEAERWAAIKQGFGRRQELVGDGDDPMANALLQLIKVNESLSGIGGAIRESGHSSAAVQEAQTQRVLEAADQRQSALADKLVPALQELGERLPNQDSGNLAESLAPVLAGLGEQLAKGQRADEQDAQAKEAKVEIINTLPKYYGKLYQHHIDVIERSLAPTLQAVSRHLDESQAVKGHLHDLVQHLRTLIDDQANSKELNRKGEELEELGDG